MAKHLSRFAFAIVECAFPLCSNIIMKLIIQNVTTDDDGDSGEGQKNAVCNVPCLKRAKGQHTKRFQLAEKMCEHANGKYMYARCAYGTELQRSRERENPQSLN